MLEVGSVIAGKLRIERILGQGGMGIVAEATHLQLEQRVAVKVMREQVAHDSSTVERFMREARAAAKLRSEHVCRVTDVGQLSNGAPYIVMEMLDGTDLAALVARKPLPIATAVDYVMQACIAIGEAHVQGIVHRDLKPANLFLTKQLGGAPLVKVLDFGIAKEAATAADAGLTHTASVMGSPGYMSPEQLRSARDVDARTDIWALGVILYQLVSSRLPFPADSVTELAVKVAMDPPAPLDVDPGFRAVVMRCLEKAPAARFADVPALAAALAPFGSESARRNLAVIEQLVPRPPADAIASTLPAVDVSARTLAATTGPSPVTTLQGATGYANVSPTTARAPRLGKLRAPHIGAGALAIVALVAGVKVMRSDDRRDPAPAPAPTRPALTDQVARFDIAIERGYCREASRLAHEIAQTGIGPPEVSKRVADCLGQQADAFQDLSSRKSAATIQTMARELLDEGFAKDARGILEVLLRADDSNMDARTMALEAACKEGVADAARTHYAKLPPTAPRDAAVVACNAKGIDVEAPAPGPKAEPKPRTVRTDAVTERKPNPPPAPADPVTAKPKAAADWKMDAGHAMMQGNYEDARDIALGILAKDPNDEHAAYIATGAYCSLDDKANALKWGKKLGDKRRADAQRFACDRANIELSAK